MVIADRWIMTAAHVVSTKGVTADKSSIQVSRLLKLLPVCPLQSCFSTLLKSSHLCSFADFHRTY